MSNIALTLPSPLNYSTQHRTTPAEELLNAGSLGMFCPSNSLRPRTTIPAVSGPSYNAVWENIAWAQAAALCGVTGSTSAQQAAVDFVLHDVSNLGGVTNILKSITPKGGLQTIVTQTVGTSTTWSFAINLPAAICSYIAANRDHVYAFDVIMYRSRVSLSNANLYTRTNSIGSGSCGLIEMSDGGDDTTQDGSGDGIEHNDAGNNNSANTNIYNQLGWNHRWTQRVVWRPDTGTINVGTDITYPSIVRAGANPPEYASNGNYNKYPSDTTYMAHLMDVTASGLGYGEIVRKHRKFFQLHCLTAGGRFFGDTLANPATLP